MELQVVWERDFSGAADGAEMISAILICAAACGSGSSSTGHCGGAVRQLQVAQQVNPVGLQVWSGYHWGAAGWQQQYFQRILVQLRVTVAAAAQDIAEGQW